KLLEPCDRRLSEGLIGEVAQGWPTPQQKRLSQLPDPGFSLARPRVSNEGLEALDVELSRFQPQRVASTFGHQRLVPQNFPHLCNLIPKRCFRRSWRRIAPELVDQSVAPDELSRVEEQEGEDGTRLRASDRKAVLPVPDF